MLDNLFPDDEDTLRDRPVILPTNSKKNVNVISSSRRRTVGLEQRFARSLERATETRCLRAITKESRKRDQYRRSIAKSAYIRSAGAYHVIYDEDLRKIGTAWKRQGIITKKDQLEEITLKGHKEKLREAASILTIEFIFRNECQNEDKEGYRKITNQLKDRKLWRAVIPPISLSLHNLWKSYCLCIVYQYFPDLLILNSAYNRYRIFFFM